jgi:HK97 family phage major capsid protein
MFVEKSLEEVSKMTLQEQQDYMTAKASHEAEMRKNEIAKAIEEAQKNNVSKEDIEKLTSKQSEIIKEIERLGLEAKASKETPTTEKENVLAKSIKDNLQTIKEIGKGITTKEITLKALTNRASIANNTQALRLPDIGQLGVKERSLYNIFPKFPIADGDNNGKIRYIDWDEATTVRAAAMVAEGGTFPESTAKFAEYSIDLRKVGDTLPVTDEFGTDEVTAAAELEMFLNTNVDSVIDAQLVNGDNTGQNLSGLITSVPAYTPVASGIVAPNIYDLVKKVRTDITKTRGSKYKPDFVVMNSNTADSLGLTKDANENYIFKDITSIGSMTIIEDNNVADNVLVVGDRRYARIYEKGGVLMSMGTVNEQFVEDTMTLKIRKRLLFLIRNVDKTGFRKVTNITTALATLGQNS